MNIPFDNYTDSEIDTVRWQLGKKTVFMMGIIERCVFNYPRIIILAPDTNEKIPGDSSYTAYSNVLWLTCPYLNKKIHSLESSGFIKKIEDMVNSDRDLKSRMQHAHASFYFLRKNMYAKFFNFNIPVDTLRVFNAGIGGIRDIHFLKCLHMHFSHNRASMNNIVGYIIEKILADNINCSEELCKDAC